MSRNSDTQRSAHSPNSEMQRPRKAIPLLTESQSPAWEERRSSRLSPDLGLQGDSLLIEAIQFAEILGEGRRMSQEAHPRGNVLFIFQQALLFQKTFSTTMAGWGQNSLSCG